jgi:hypothetical protein
VFLCAVGLQIVHSGWLAWTSLCVQHGNWFEVSRLVDGVTSFLFLQTEGELEASRLIDDLGLQDRQQYVCAIFPNEALLFSNAFFSLFPLHMSDDLIYVSA